jgi:hypothetical protein
MVERPTADIKVTGSFIKPKTSRYSFLTKLSQAFITYINNTCLWHRLKMQLNDKVKNVVSKSLDMLEIHILTTCQQNICRTHMNHSFTADK